MELAASEDSYCTTDDERNNNKVQGISLSIDSI